MAFRAARYFSPRIDELNGTGGFLVLIWSFLLGGVLLITSIIAAMLKLHDRASFVFGRQDVGERQKS